MMRFKKIGEIAKRRHYFHSMKQTQMEIYDQLLGPSWSPTPKCH
jgi:hypothetical protein